MMIKFLTITGIVLGAFCATAEARVCVKDDNGEIISCTGGSTGSPSTTKPFRDRFFQFNEKATMQHTFIGNTPVILDTDFISNAVNGARAKEGIFELRDGGHLFAIVERQGYKAVLIDQGGFDKLRREALTSTRCNAQQCVSSVIGGAIEGGLAGGLTGATAGAFFGPKGAAGGLVLGGTAGSVGGALKAYGQTEACNCPGGGSDGGPGFNGGPSGTEEKKKDEELPKNAE